MNLYSSNLEKIPRYHDRVGVRFDRLPVEPLILLKLISTLGRNLGTISLYRVDRIWRIPSSTRISLNVLPFRLHDIRAKKFFSSFRDNTSRLTPVLLSRLIIQSQDLPWIFTAFFTSFERKKFRDSVFRSFFTFIRFFLSLSIYIYL